MIMLEQNIEPHQVHLLEVWVGNSIINMVLRDKRNQFTEESFFLIFILLTSYQFLIDKILVREIVSQTRINLIVVEVAVAHIIL